MVSRALVTGATGGIGLSLAPALLRHGLQVVATGRRAEPGVRLAAAGAAFHAADLAMDPLAPLLEGVDTVFHLAARSAPWGAASAFERDNVAVTRRLLAAARDAGVRRFVFASTPSIYAERRDRLDLTEASPVARAFSGDYARTKYRAEQLVLAADTPEMRTIALRPRAVAGPDDAVLLPRLARVAARGRIPLPRGGEALIEITDVRDVAEAFIAAARPDVAGGIAVNISGGNPRPFKDLVAEVCRVSGLPYRPLSLPEPVLYGAAGVAEAAAQWTRREPAITRHGAMVIAWSQTFDLSAAERLLDWTPRHSPEETIRFSLSTGGTA